ncbi:unnamed protein product [Thlaspi arvense]|uniref:Uncharacterized protein n=1 Tax=Thlaspi arvense TaxID=13288 RepID=A0AAU9T077_THLAR|nr:unnamed protein product [Thlaspi arvense]
MAEEASELRPPRRLIGVESKRKKLKLQEQRERLYGDRDEDDDDSDDAERDESVSYWFDLNVGNRKRLISTWGDNYEIDLFGRLGLHCYNLQKGTNLKFVRWEKHGIESTAHVRNFITLEAKDEVSDSLLSFQTMLSDASYVPGSFKWTTCACRLRGNERVDDTWDDKAVADFYKVAMPKWSSVEHLASENLKYYVVQDSELQENDWLHLFTEIAFYAKKRRLLPASPPVEIEKVVVVTEEDTADAREKLRAKNAVFYISYKCEDEDHKATIRRTMDGKPEHMRLEVASDFKG